MQTLQTHFHFFSTPFLRPAKLFGHQFNDAGQYGFCGILIEQSQRQSPSQHIRGALGELVPCDINDFGFNVRVLRV